MGTTYARIWSAMREATNKTEWDSYAELAHDIREKKLSDFRVRGEGDNIEDYMRESSIRRLLRFMEELGLILQTDGSVTLTENAKRSLATEDAYKRQIRSSVKNYLEEHALPLDDILAVIREVQLPEVPDAQTIYTKLVDRDHRVTDDRLRTLLYLYSLADGIERITRVHYSGE